MENKNFILLFLTVFIFIVPVNATLEKVYDQTNDSVIFQDDITHVVRVNLSRNSSVFNLVTADEFLYLQSYVNYTFSGNDFNYSYTIIKGNNPPSFKLYLLNETTKTWNNINPTGVQIKTGKTYSLWLHINKKAESGETSLKDWTYFQGIKIDEFSWWNTSWKNSYHNDLQNDTRPFQYSLNISNNTNPFGNTTHLNVVCAQSNCTDLRFVLDNTTEMPIWRETNTTTNGSGWYGIWWVNVTQNGTVDIYTNATGVPDSSNGTNTFLFFDDFSTNTSSKYSITGGGSISVSNGIMTWTGVNSGNSFVTLTSQNPPTKYITEANLSWTHRASTTSATVGFGGFFNSNTTPTTWYVASFGYLSSVQNLYIALETNNIANVAQSFTEGTTYRIKGNWSASNLEATFNRSKTTTSSDNSHTSGFFGFRSFDADAKIDWWYVRNYASPNPVWSVWGNVTLGPIDVPNVPTNLTDFKTSDSINWSWLPNNSINITDRYVILVNGTYHNSTNTFFNSTGLSPGDVSDITVWAVNDTVGSISLTSVGSSDSIPLINPLLTNVTILRNCGVVYNVNNTNLAPTFSGQANGTGERVNGLTYFANNTSIQIFLLSHANAAGTTSDITLYINGIIVSHQATRPIGTAENVYTSIVATIPKGASYKVVFANFHHYEWREYESTLDVSGCDLTNNNIYGLVILGILGFLIAICCYRKSKRRG